MKTKENIYKIGKSKQENLTRITNYSKGTQLIMQITCSDCDVAEQKLMDIFKEDFIHRKDIGSEYFEGDYHVMVRHIFNFIEGEVDKKEFFIVDSYDKYTMITGLEKFIISNFITKEGIVKLKNDGWYKIYSFDEDDDIDYTLIDWLKRYSVQKIICESNTTKEIIEYKNVHKLRNFESKYSIYYGIYYHYDKIMRDICVRCYRHDFVGEDEEYIIEEPAKTNYICDTMRYLMTYSIVFAGTYCVINSCVS